MTVFVHFTLRKNINPDAYNGNVKIQAIIQNFMSQEKKQSSHSKSKIAKEVIEYQ